MAAQIRTRTAALPPARRRERRNVRQVAPGAVEARTRQPAWRRVLDDESAIVLPPGAVLLLRPGTAKRQLVQMAALR